jgi:hypothetical protein
MQSLTPWRHLHQWVKQKTADLQRLLGETTSNPPFSELPSLSTQISEQFQKHSIFTGKPIEKVWLRALGTELLRIELDSEEDTQRVRSLAKSLANTLWIETEGLEIIPYIGGTPAGTPRQADVVWLDHAVYVDRIPRARLARRVPEEIGKAFARSDIKAVLDYSFERSAEDIREYLEENFKLSYLMVAPTGPIAAPGVKSVGRPATTAQPISDGDVAEVSPVRGTEEDLPTEIVAETMSAIPAGYADEEQTFVDDIATPEPRPRPTLKLAKASIMERFAKRQGFRKDSDDRFFHQNGSWIGKAVGARFPWEHRTAGGDLVRYYWPKDHCLVREPLQLEADIWGLMEQHPDTYALILSDLEDGPVEVTGASLRSMRDEGKVTLYPASYRLVYDNAPEV